ncbi:transcriptional regulator [Halorutilales archaeon Cl-col2-1]
MSETDADTKNIAVLGTGGIGKRTLEVSEYKDDLNPVAVCDKEGVAIDFDGLEVDDIVDAVEADGGTVAKAPGGTPANDSIQEVIEVSDRIDAVLMALPNIPHSFIPDTVDRFADAGYSGVMIDVLKRSRVIGMLEDMESKIEASGITFICGAGATPGFLTGAAAIASQSFVEVDEIEIWWGVGIASGYEENKGTVREDIAHLPEYDLEKVSEMSDDEIEEIIEEHDGRLEFEDMEHADEVLLEKAGICDSADVKVGGILDVTQDEKPTTTTVRVTGTTFEGDEGTNTFKLDDNTSMAANVNGPALGYLKKGVFLNQNGLYGLFDPSEIMPGF